MRELKPDPKTDGVCGLSCHHNGGSSSYFWPLYTCMCSRNSDLGAVQRLFGNMKHY